MPEKPTQEPVFSFYAGDTSVETKVSPPSREHCWHDTGLALTSMPAQHEQVCCWCGARRYLTYAMGNTPGHGKHAPFLFGGICEPPIPEPVVRGGEGPCVPA